MSSPSSSPSSSPEDSDTLYRSHLRSLASLLVPPSAPIISSLLATALSSLSPALATPLEWGHDEQNIDFWDARREKDWGEGREERWEMSREEVEGIKRERKECADRVREAGRDEERWQLERWSIPPFLSEDFLLSRRARQASQPSPRARLSMQEQLAALTGPPPKRLLPKPDEAMLAMDAMPDVDEALDTRLSATEHEIAFIKRARAEHKQRGKLSALDSLKTREDDAHVPLSDSSSLPLPRLGSPPLFPRRTSLPAVVKPNPLRHLQLTSEMSIPSSPGVSMRDWNREEGIASPPISPSKFREEAAKPVKVWSSDAPDTLLDGGRGEAYQLDKPIFSRPASKNVAFDLSTLLPANEDDLEIDQLDSSSDEGEVKDMQRLQESVQEQSIQELMRSDETMAEAGEVARAGELLTAVRLKIPRLPPPLSSLPSLPPLPTLSSFTSSSSSPWSLQPPTGLRSISIALSWSLPDPTPQTLQELIGGEEGEEEVREEARGVRRAWEEGVREVEEEGLGRGELGVWPGGEEEGETGGEVEVERKARKMEVLAAIERGAAQDEMEEGERPRNNVEDDVDSFVEAERTHVDASTRQDLNAAVAHSPHLPSPPQPYRSPSTAPNPPSASPPRPPSAVAPRPFSSPAPHASSEPYAANLSSDSFGFRDLASSLAASPPRNTPSPLPLQPDVSTGVSAARPAPRDVNSRTAARPPADEAAQLDPLDALAVERLAGFKAEKADSTVATSSHSTALSRFLATRGITASAPSRSTASSNPSAPAPAQRAPSPHSSPPPGAIPFTLPPFLSAPSSALSPSRASVSPSHPLRIIAFDALFQLRPHLAALVSAGFLPVHRPSRFPTSPYVTHEPHLILDAKTAVWFVPLVELISNAVRPDETTSLTVSRQRKEAVFTTLVRLSYRFDRLLLVLEESSTFVGGRKTYAYTPPVLAGLQALATALAGGLGGEGGEGRETVKVRGRVEVALSKGPEGSAEVVRRLMESLAATATAEGEEGEGNGWGESEWLRDDPTTDESTLLHLLPSSELNEFSAALILSIFSFEGFLALSPQDRLDAFGEVLGEERVNRISQALATSSPPLGQNGSSSSGDGTGGRSGFLSLSQIGQGGEEGGGGGEGGSEGGEGWFDYERYAMDG